MDEPHTPPAAAAPAQEKRDEKGVKIILDEPTHTCAMVEEKAEEIVEAENERLDQLMAEFTKGFDPGILADEISQSLSKILENVFPGSYEHLLSMLFECDAAMHNTQVDLERWLLDRYSQILYQITQRGETHISDETYFGAEIEVLRKILAPLRGEAEKPVFWLNSRRVNPAKALRELEASVTVVELFKKDVIAALQTDTEDRKIYNPLPVSRERTALISIKQLRIDACQKTLSWDGYADSEIVLTAFYNAYKNYTCENRPDKAREWGWLPPTDLEPPRPSTEKAEEGDLVMWPFEHERRPALDLLLKTALWLCMARGLPAVHLFCDTCRLFTTHIPGKDANATYVRFLRHVAQTRVVDKAIKSAPPTPIPFKKKPKKTSNDDYFDDVWRSDKSLAEDLAKKPTLYGMTTAKHFKLNEAPPPRSFRKRAEMIEKACIIEEDYSEVWPQKDPLPVQKPRSPSPQPKLALRPQEKRPYDDDFDEDDCFPPLNW
ncbi:hypothetical protein BO71DRAFT_417875 [Aspergillus ellipticus CBS 707.79]|uniref:Uncharacterized protein n=1 Tax=Aspergillus ellipticus CBS 707.79 TaxID=1448320 RepID=A0A319DGF0_9EURO|nr:hypothetical protein BO71DRAFT_417875 [Aspergillus ellipticus CBS 707.79]